MHQHNNQRLTFSIPRTGNEPDVRLLLNSFGFITVTHQPFTVMFNQYLPLVLLQLHTSLSQLRLINIFLWFYDSYTPAFYSYV